jgi:flagellar FliL protein
MELGMAKKEEKKDDKKPKEPATPEQQAAAAKKKKIIIAAVGGLLIVGGGAFAALKMLGSSDKKAAETPKSEHGESSEHGEPGEHESESVDGHAEGNADGHGEGSGDKKTEKDGAKDPHATGGENNKADPHAKADSLAAQDGKSDAKGNAPGDTSHGEGKEATAGAGKPGRYSGIGLMYDMKPFHLNLGNPLENRYVRLEVRFEYPNEDQKVELKARDSQIRDAVVSIVSRKTREHLLSPDGKDQLRLEIKNRVNQYLEKKITNVYITDILIE